MELIRTPWRCDGSEAPRSPLRDVHLSFLTGKREDGCGGQRQEGPDLLFDTDVRWKFLFEHHADLHDQFVRFLQWLSWERKSPLNASSSSLSKKRMP